MDGINTTLALAHSSHIFSFYLICFTLYDGMKRTRSLWQESPIIPPKHDGGSAIFMGGGMAWRRMESLVSVRILNLQGQGVIWAMHGQHGNMNLLSINIKIEPRWIRLGIHGREYTR